MTLKREAIEDALQTADPTGITYGMAHALLEINEAVDNYESRIDAPMSLRALSDEHYRKELIQNIKRILGRGK
jgi:hypothetical protein